ncbi:hypothetical protein CRUP_022379 [Coryphaenoides rupestris]|nr:hypothetical protein CRUP_022379 [Coryphaenoides rupestris]
MLEIKLHTRAWGLYAVGGRDGSSCLRSVESFDPHTNRYDPQTDAWTTVAPMSLSRDAVGVCLLGDRLYAVAPLCLGRAGACVVAVKL